MIRTMDAAFLNRVVNDETVRPFVGGEGDLDLTPALANPANVALVNEHGGFLFEFHDPGRYEGHTMFLPSGRGAAAFGAAADAFRYLFTRTEAVEIVTKVPGSNRGADLMARRLGFQSMFERQGAWPDGSKIEYWGLSLDRWRALDKTLPGEGRAFHDLLEAAKSAAGSALDTHPDDDAHDRAAGLAVLMAKAGQVRKAAWAYNRWARFAGYQLIELLSEAPAVIDVKDAIVAVRDGELEVLKCR
jgi:hypothetical protein